MRRMRCASLLITHLLCIPVVCRDKQDVPRLLRGSVDSANCLVGFGDGNDSGIIYAGVPDLVGHEMWK
jgi:hypothetical protein